MNKPRQKSTKKLMDEGADNMAGELARSYLRRSLRLIQPLKNGDKDKMTSEEKLALEQDTDRNAILEKAYASIAPGSIFSGHYKVNPSGAYSKKHDVFCLKGLEHHQLIDLQREATQKCAAALNLLWIDLTAAAEIPEKLDASRVVIFGAIETNPEQPGQWRLLGRPENESINIERCMPLLRRSFMSVIAIDGLFGLDRHEQERIINNARSQQWEQQPLPNTHFMLTGGLHHDMTALDGMNVHTLTMDDSPELQERLIANKLYFDSLGTCMIGPFLHLFPQFVDTALKKDLSFNCSWLSFVHHLRTVAQKHGGLEQMLEHQEELQQIALEALHPDAARLFMDFMASMIRPMGLIRELFDEAYLTEEKITSIMKEVECNSHLHLGACFAVEHALLGRKWEYATSERGSRLIRCLNDDCALMLSARIFSFPIDNLGVQVGHGGTHYDVVQHVRKIIGSTQLAEFINGFGKGKQIREEIIQRQSNRMMAHVTQDRLLEAWNNNDSYSTPTKKVRF